MFCECRRRLCDRSVWGDREEMGKNEARGRGERLGGGLPRAANSLLPLTLSLFRSDFGSQTRKSAKERYASVASEGLERPRNSGVAAPSSMCDTGALEALA